MTRAGPQRWIGLVAGAGELPQALMEEAVRRGLGVVVVRLDDGSPGQERPPHAGGRRAHDAHRGWVRERRLKACDWDELVRTFVDHAVEVVYAAGKINRLRAAALFEQAAAGEGRDLYEGGRYKEDQALSQVFADALARRGIRLGSQHELLGHLLAPAGVLTARPPDERERADIEVGRRLAKEVAALDIGQTVVVRNGVVVAVETAVEGTDATIRRAGRLAGPGSVVVKVSRPDQDPRFDTPVVGPGTIRAARAAGASCLAIEAGRCLVLHQKAVVRAADRAGIAVVACC